MGNGAQGHNEDCLFHTLPINVPIETKYDGRGGANVYRHGGGATKSGVRIDVTYRKP